MKVQRNKRIEAFSVGVFIGILVVLNVQTYLINKSKVDYKFGEIISTLENQYIDDFDKDDFIEYMYRAGMTYFNNPDTFNDPYTVYFPKQNYDSFRDNLEGSYSGVGILLEKNEIQEVFENSPAQKAGLIPGDLILKINDDEVSDNIQIVSKIKDFKDDEEFTIVIQRLDKIFQTKLMKEKVKMNVVESKPTDEEVEIPNEIGYIGLKQFTNNSYSDLKNKLDTEYSDKQGIIIDLRGNPGGYLTEVRKILMYLTSQNDTIFYEQYKGKLIEHRGHGESYAKPIVVLVDENSVSASEVMASSLQENKIAILIGNITYGKGVIQSTHSFEDGSGMKFTVGKWLTPQKNDVNNTGVKPDYIVEGYNEQLLKAIEIMQDITSKNSKEK
ncbi:S41 family peptidase [Alkaliphilus sp. B6464]|uniref:S41 family peptidase n=1 Tax=Alkaliphilus sp. B6464 TaxID=2731219 RepID=UPI001BA6E2FD|nr:S41 family peptidase [Alkaliphilus sp. B6464]QUH22180.1 PDZ domain-containing protein [Alkaliphilus sp. B6464]